jgi:hypothetical protein
VQSLFQGQQQRPEEPEKETQQEQNEPPFSVEDSSVDRRSRPLEERLDNFPDEISAESATRIDGKAEEGVKSEDIAALSEEAQSLIEEAGVSEIVAEMFDILAEHFGSDHWRLGPRQVRMLGAPLTALLRHVWKKLAEKIPDVLARWCEETPGATMLVVSLGLVVVPRVVQQGKLNKQRGRSMWSVAPFKQLKADSSSEKQPEEKPSPTAQPDHDPFKHVPVWTGEKAS